MKKKGPIDRSRPRSNTNTILIVYTKGPPLSPREPAATYTPLTFRRPARSAIAHYSILKIRVSLVFVMRNIAEPRITMRGWRAALEKCQLHARISAGETSQSAIRVSETDEFSHTRAGARCGCAVIWERRLRPPSLETCAAQFDRCLMSDVCWLAGFLISARYGITSIFTAASQ